MPSSNPVPCDCCSGNVLCWQVIEYGDPSPIGEPACETTIEFELIKYFFKSSVDDLETAIQSALGGSVTIDCSSEVSGYCRSIGSSGAYDLWSKLVFEGKEIYGDPDVVGTSVVMWFTVEDCGSPGLPPPDLEVSLLIRRVNPGQEITVSGATVPLDCDGWNDDD